METTPFFILLFFHLSFLILGFGSVIITDLFGLLWISDRVRFRHLVNVSGNTEYFVWSGWTGMLLTGVPLVLLKGKIDELMTIKLILVALIGLNGIPLHILHNRLEKFHAEDEIPNRFMFHLGFSLFLSQTFWWGAMGIGFLHRHVQTIIEWPPRPWLVMLIVLSVLLILWAAGEGILKIMEKRSARNP